MKCCNIPTTENLLQSKIIEILSASSHLKEIFSHGTKIGERIHPG